MTAEQKHYAWDRLLRAAVRAQHGNLSDAQRADMADSLGAADDDALKGALGSFVAGTLTPENAAAGLKQNLVDGFNADLYRASFAPPPSSSALTDTALKALLES